MTDKTIGDFLNMTYKTIHDLAPFSFYTFIANHCLLPNIGFCNIDYISLEHIHAFANFIFSGIFSLCYFLSILNLFIQFEPARKVYFSLPFVLRLFFCLYIFNLLKHAFHVVISFTYLISLESILYYT